VIEYEFVRRRVKTSRGRSIIHSTSLIWKLIGKLAIASVVDIYNWPFHVTYAILVGGSNERWTWFMERLYDVIGHLSGLVIHTDACKGLENNYDVVFPRIKHRECM
jgi:hypothetical protein